MALGNFSIFLHQSMGALYLGLALLMRRERILQTEYLDDRRRTLSYQ